MNERSCPICRRSPAEGAYRPFCSRRCADVDLQRWFAGVYAAPVEGASEPDPLPSSFKAGRCPDDPL